jgi:hypothetical protein
MRSAVPPDSLRNTRVRDGASKMAAPRSAPEGLDYVPVPGSDPNLVFGVIRATLAGVSNTAMSAVFRRLFPVAKPRNPQAPWPKATCFKSDVLLPDWTNVDYYDPQVLCRAFDAQTWEGVRDLAIIINFRFPETLGVDGAPPTMSLTGAYELARAYSYEKLTRERGLAAVIAMHVPSRAGIVDGFPHCHVIGLCRSLVGPAGFGPFRPELCRDSSREIIEGEWASWRADWQRAASPRALDHPTDPPAPRASIPKNSRRKSRR